MEIVLFIIIFIVVYSLAFMGLLFIIRTILDWYLKRYGTTKWRIDE